MYILGIWDGHDAGACIVSGKEILIAVNEERLTKRKLDVGFPYHSIKLCLNYLKLKPTDIGVIALSTSDFAKTLTRYLPSLKEKYYHFRRRKSIKPSLPDLRRGFKYKLTELGSSAVTKKLTEVHINKKLRSMGFKNFKIYIVEHHLAHAASAAYTSGMKKSLVLTLDGIGDGLSGTVNIFKDGNIERISSISGKDSLGIFFEQVTNLLNMRELEDEGKVMALANFSAKIPDSKNKMIDFFKVNGLNIESKYSMIERYKKLKQILWSSSSEQFAYMSQRVLEKNLIELFDNCIKETGIKDISWAGGVASNIKTNQKIISRLRKWHIFPHMGDGGLAVGAALHCNFMLKNIKMCNFSDAYLGPEYGDGWIKKIKKSKFKVEKYKDIEGKASDIISKNNFVLWFQGRMELGPRALGNRSILAPADSQEIKDELNLKVKQRSWFQPFCPSLLQEDARKVFNDVRQFDKYMVTGFKVKERFIDKMTSVMNVDNTARAQMLGNENKRFKKLLKNIKKDKGISAVLNTSFNLHGYPIVNTPLDAIDVFNRTKSEYLIIGNYLITK